MNQDCKQNLLEMVVLLILNKNDHYGYDLVEEVHQLLTIKEGITYPILKKLIIERKIEAYMKEDDVSLRKYYKLTQVGKLALKKMTKEYKNFTSKIEDLLKGFDIYD